MSDNPSGEAFVWSGSELLLTHCRHGLDLRLNPRCYLCVTPAATPSPLDDDVDGVDCDWDERGKCRCRVATPAPLDVMVATVAVPLDVLDSWHDLADRLSLEMLAHFDVEHTKTVTREAMLDASRRVRFLAYAAWLLGHSVVDGKWAPPTRYMRLMANGAPPSPPEDSFAVRPPEALSWVCPHCDARVNPADIKAAHFPAATPAPLDDPVRGGGHIIPDAIRAAYPEFDSSLTPTPPDAPRCDFDCDACRDTDDATPAPLALTPDLFSDLGEVLAAMVYEADDERYICRMCDSDVTASPHSDDCEVKHLREWTFAANKAASPAPLDVHPGHVCFDHARYDGLRDWWDGLDDAEKREAYLVEKGNADALALAPSLLDVSRLAEAIASTEWDWRGSGSSEFMARVIAAAYADDHA